MVKGPEQTFFQSYTNGQQVYKKMLNITNHQENRNQIKAISPHTCWMSIIKKERKSQCDKDVEKNNTCTLLECKLVQPLWETVQFPKKI